MPISMATNVGVFGATVGVGVVVTVGVRPGCTATTNVLDGVGVEVGLPAPLPGPITTTPTSNTNASSPAQASGGLWRSQLQATPNQSLRTLGSGRSSSNRSDSGFSAAMRSVRSAFSAANRSTWGSASSTRCASAYASRILETTVLTCWLSSSAMRVRAVCAASASLLSLLCNRRPS